MTSCQEKNKGTDVQLDMLSTLPWLDGEEAVFEMKLLSAAFLELACREQVYLPGLLNGSFGLAPDVQDDCTANFTVKMQTEELVTTVKAARCADITR